MSSCLVLYKQDEVHIDLPYRFLSLFKLGAAVNEQDQSEHSVEMTANQDWSTFRSNSSATLSLRFVLSSSLHFRSFSVVGTTGGYT
jgi:hypothetical protein